jgi:hypothetical protein
MSFFCSLFCPHFSCRCYSPHRLQEMSASTSYTEGVHKQFLEDKTVIANILQYVNDEKFKVTESDVEASGLPQTLLEESLARCTSS